jgi:hypothetical protein
LTQLLAEVREIKQILTGIISEQQKIVLVALIITAIALGIRALLRKINGG